MTIKDLILQVSNGYQDADIPTLEVWNGQLSCEFAFLAENIGETKKNRALTEIKIKQRLVKENGKTTEKEIEREYYATPEGQFLALNSEYIKALGKLISAVRFKIDCLRGKI